MMLETEKEVALEGEPDTKRSRWTIPIVSGVIGAIVCSCLTYYLGVRPEKDKIASARLVQSTTDDQPQHPQPTQDQRESREKLIKLNTLLSGMRNSTDLLEFRKDAAHFMNNYDTQPYVGELDLGDHVEDAYEQLEGIREQLISFLHECASDLTPKRRIGATAGQLSPISNHLCTPSVE
jgi:hypothetical protein